MKLAPLETTLVNSLQKFSPSPATGPVGQVHVVMASAHDSQWMLGRHGLRSSPYCIQVIHLYLHLYVYLCLHSYLYSDLHIH